MVLSLSQAQPQPAQASSLAAWSDTRNAHDRGVLELIKVGDRRVSQLCSLQGIMVRACRVTHELVTQG